MTDQPIDAVCLDVGGVLLFPPPEAAWAVLGCRDALDQDRHRHAHYTGMVAYDRGQGDWNAYLRGFCRGYGVAEPELSEAAVALGQTLAETPWSTVFEESVEGLRLLSATGVKLAVISNSDGTAEGQLARLGICQVGPGRGVRVEVVVDSSVVGIAKPDPAIFELTLRTVGARPENTLHVGDCVYADVGGAVAAGLRPLHFDPLGVCEDSGHEHVRGLVEVARIVAS
jgi:putative hydrolase of the HAD superfamily